MMDGAPRTAAQIVTEALTPLPELTVHGDNLPATVHALRDLLARAGDVFDRGGVPVRLAYPADGGPPIARMMTYNNVIVLAHSCCQPVRFDADRKSKGVTLPASVAKMYLDLGDWRLAPLFGVSMAPLLSADGDIRSAVGYDRERALWCEPVCDVAVPTHPTRMDAETALKTLRATFRTFPFKDAATITRRDGICVLDLAVPPRGPETNFLALLLTAVCRPSLPIAPAGLIVAPETTGAGSGKGLLTRSICAIAFGYAPSAFTGGHDRQELDKRLVAALIEGAPVVFLDNVNSTTLHSATLASVITERPAHVRIMGESRMVPLNSAAFIAITGNGLSVTEDLARRFLIVDLDPQCEDPEARPFKPGFLEALRARRAELLSACLTIWRWGRQNGSSLSRGLPLGSFELWAEWVRDPLLTLGCADPVQRIRDAKASDPRRRFVAELFTAWWHHHGAKPMKAADLDDEVMAIVNPQGRGRQYVAQRLMHMNGTRGAGFVLTYQPPARDGAKTGGTYVLQPIAPRADTDPAPQSSHSPASKPGAAASGDRDEWDAQPRHVPEPGPLRTDDADDLGAPTPRSQTQPGGETAPSGFMRLRMNNDGDLGCDHS